MPKFRARRDFSPKLMSTALVLARPHVRRIKSFGLSVLRRASGLAANKHAATVPGCPAVARIPLDSDASRLVKSPRRAFESEEGACAMFGLNPRSQVCRILVASLALPMLLAYYAPPTIAVETATIRGGVVDLDGRPAAGFRVLVTEQVSGRTYTSAPTGADGGYALEVAAEGRLIVAGVVAPDGTHIPVQQSTSLSIPRAGLYRLDVRFTSLAGGPTAQPRPPSIKAPAPATHPARPALPAKGSLGAAPWWKRPGGVVGIAGGGIVLLAVAGSGGGSSAASPSTSSPSSPPP